MNNQNTLPRRLTVRGLNNCRNFKKGWNNYRGQFHFMCNINKATWRLLMGWRRPGYKKFKFRKWFPLDFKKELLLSRLKREGKI